MTHKQRTLFNEALIMLMHLASFATQEGDRGNKAGAAKYAEQANHVRSLINLYANNQDNTEIEQGLEELVVLFNQGLSGTSQ